MSQLDTIRLISEILSRRLVEKGAKLPALHPDMALLGGEIGIDSLDLATLVVELEERTGKDPFHDGFRNFTTVGELASLYADA
jgi:acyl carrier protein